MPKETMSPCFYWADMTNVISKFRANYEQTAENVLNHKALALAAALNSMTLMHAERSSLND